MSRKLMRAGLIVFFLGVLVGLACTGPARLVGPTDTVEAVEGTLAATTTLTPLISQPPGDLNAMVTAYPGPPVVPSESAGPPAYPGPGMGGDQPYPGLTEAPLLPTASLQTQSVYPGPDFSGTTSPTPVMVFSTTPTPTGATPYPGPGGGITTSPTSVFAGTPSITPLPTWTPTPTTIYLVYTVKQGDTCGSIAFAFSVSIQSILLANNLPTNCSTLTVGQQLLIPQPTPTVAASPTDVLVGTPTPFSSPTPLPTATMTPIPTPTLLPPPPWVSSNLRATDPSTVELASGRVQLIWFFAFWDGPSKAMAPLVHGLEAQYSDRMNFIYLDIDDPGTDFLKSTLGYRSQPHFFLIDANGNILHQWRGYVSVEEFQKAFEAALR